MRTVHVSQNNTARGKAIEVADQLSGLNIHDPKYWDFVNGMEVLFKGGDIPEPTEAENKLLEKLNNIEGLFDEVESEVGNINYELRRIRKDIEEMKKNA